MDQITNRLKQLVGPTKEYISIGQAKTDLRFSNSLQDSVIARLIIASRLHTETRIGRLIGEQTWQWKMESFPTGLTIYLPKPPLRELLKITYIDVDGNSTDWYDSTASPAVDPGTIGIETDTEPGFIYLHPTENWPTDDLFTGLPITIQYKCGLDLDSPEQHNLIQGMMMLLSHWFEHREAAVIGSMAQMNAIASAMIPFGYEEIISPFIFFDDEDPDE